MKARLFTSVSALRLGLAVLCTMALWASLLQTSGSFAADPAPASAAIQYPPEDIYDTAMHQDEALVNVGLAVNRWPDCTTLESTTADIFRIEDAVDKSDPEKAMALWKWHRVLMRKGPGPNWEGPRGKMEMLFEPHKILTCYGTHSCMGLSWTLEALWRGGGYIAFPCSTSGHTIASLRYRDADGQMRFHDFDPLGGFYFWDPVHERVSTRSVPMLPAGHVHQRLRCPPQMHSLRAALRWGETVVRSTDNTGHVVPVNDPKKTLVEAGQAPYFVYSPGKKSGVYAVVGEEVQTLEADTTPEGFASALYDGSANTACSPALAGRAALHPAQPNVPAYFIYRLAPPYVIADANLEATLVKGAQADTCTISISTDGKNWQTVFEKDRPGQEQVAINTGQEARTKELPDVYTAYNVYVRAEFKTAGDVRRVGLNALKITAFRMINRRSLPHLRPGTNALKVTADRIAPALALELSVSFEVDGQPHAETRVIQHFPYYFTLDLAGGRADALTPLSFVPVSVRMRLVRAAEVTATRPQSLSEADGRRLFALSSPYPGNLGQRKNVEKTETDVMQTNGFLPQSKAVLHDEAAMKALIEKFRQGSEAAAQELGNYPEAIDALLEGLPGAHCDMTFSICKALAQIADRKAVGPLLKAWKSSMQAVKDNPDMDLNRLTGGPQKSPGTRYIPDVLAAIGDRSVVPQLVEGLSVFRFDYRFHIAHALGILGGPEAEKALEDMAARDPTPAVRKEAASALQALRAKH